MSFITKPFGASSHLVSRRLIAGLVAFLLIVELLPAPSVWAEEIASSVSTEISASTPTPAPTNEPIQSTAEAVAPATEEVSVPAAPVIPGDEVVPPAEVDSLAKPALPSRFTPPRGRSSSSMQTLSVSSGSSGAGGASVSGAGAVNSTTPKTDLTSGALTFEVPLRIPAGRNGMQPSVALRYNSRSNDQGSVVGYGWSLAIPSIERVNRKGVDRIYESNVFNSSLSGELVTDGAGGYAPKIESGDFLQYSFVNNSWTVVDKKGVTYRFGTSTAARQDSPNNTELVTRWMLEEVRDLSGNSVKYSYYKEQGQIYSATITYTEHATTPGIFMIEFVREQRPDVTTSYQGQFLTKNLYRIKEILIKTSGVVTTKYALSYGQSQASQRSLLTSIAESGWDDKGVMTTLPPTSFEYQQDAISFNPHPDKAVPSSHYLTRHLSEYASQDQAGRFVDINGDGLTDLVTALGDWNNPTPPQTIFMNSSTGWQKTEWRNPFGDITTIQTSGLPLDGGQRFVDVNGDGRVDVIVARRFKLQQGSDWRGEVYINDGANWSLDERWVIPQNFATTFWEWPMAGGARRTSDYGGRMADVNGDGLVDLLVSVASWDIRGGAINEVHLNTGSGWELAKNWRIPVTFEIRDQTDIGEGAQLADINGDGLADIVVAVLGSAGYSNISRKEIYLNTGSGWNLSSDWQIPGDFCLSYFFAYRSSIDCGGRLVDINNDGLTDLVTSASGTLNGAVQSKTYLNTGSGWLHNEHIRMPSSFTTLVSADIARDEGGQLVDLTGDGMLDFVISRKFVGGTGISETYVNYGKKPDVLTKIKNGVGGTSKVQYTAVVGPKLPFAMDVVKNITTVQDDGGGVPTTESYEYAGGAYIYRSAYDRQFAGFAKVTATRADGAKTVTYSHQGNGDDTLSGELGDSIGLVARPYFTELYEASGVLRTRERMRYAVTTVGAGESARYAVLPVQSLIQTFDPGTTAIVAYGKRMTYDVVGNLTKHEDFGTVTPAESGLPSLFANTGSTDTIITTNTYAKPVVGSGIPQVVSAYPVSSIQTNASGAKLSEVRYLYDGLASGVKQGLVTTEQRRVTSALMLSRALSYNTLGQVVSETDFNGNTTQTAYDAASLYPATVTNPLGHATRLSYSTACGQAVKTTDANGAIKQTSLDGLCRAILMQQSSPTSATTLQTVASNIFEPLPNGWKITQMEYLTATDGKRTVTYTDPFGRTIQTRVTAPTSIIGEMAVSDTGYDALGRVITQSLPYASAGDALTSATHNTALRTQTSYDVLSRPLSITNVLGTTSFAYAGLVTTVTDAQGNKKALTKNIRGDLTRVVEVGKYTTSYAYDLPGRLIKITDAVGNIRNFTYDLMGRRTKAEDLHVSTDTTFGIYAYSYDANGNVTLTITPRGGQIVVTHDALNRPVSRMTKTESGAIEATETYTYDTGCTNGKGRLCTVQTHEYTKTLIYDLLGRTTQEGLTYASVPKMPQMAYPSVVGVTPPPPVVIPTTYTASSSYNLRGDVTLRTEPNGTKIRYTYSPAGPVMKIDYLLPGATSYKPLVAYTYGIHGQIESAVFANKTTTKNTYDASRLYRLTNRTTTTTVSMTGNLLATGPMLQNTSYEYDAVGNITKRTDASQTKGAGTTIYTHDTLYRLTKAVSTPATGVASTEAFTYDALGNILTKSTNGAVTTYRYKDAVDTLANPHAALQIGAALLSYDKDGNVVNDGQQGYTWNILGQLTSAVPTMTATTTALPVVTSHRYDIAGQRIAKISTQGTETKNFTLYPSKTYNLDQGGKGTVTIMGAQGVVANLEFTSGQTPKIYTVATDHLGSTQLVTGADGKSVQVQGYASFGDITLSDKAAGYGDTQRKYIGQHYDTQADLDYLNARYYHARSGRFISQDPAFWTPTADELKAQMVNPQLWNTYSYAGNNPVGMKDESGRMAPTPDIVWDGGNLAYDASSIKSNILWSALGWGVSEVGKNIGNSRIEQVGRGMIDSGKQGAKNAVTDLAFDSTAFLIPGVPAGTTKAVRAISSLGQAEKLINRIVTGHAFDKHVQGIKNINGKEWGSLIRNPEQFAEHLRQIIAKPSDYYKGGGKEVWWDNRLGTMIINNPINPTAFRPVRGKAYFDEEVARLKQKK